MKYKILYQKKDIIILHFYNSIYKAKDNKVVVLSGTPIFDKPNEIALTLNLLKLPKLILSRFKI